MGVQVPSPAFALPLRISGRRTGFDLYPKRVLSLSLPMSLEETRVMVALAPLVCGNMSVSCERGCDWIVSGMGYFWDDKGRSGAKYIVCLGWVIGVTRLLMEGWQSGQMQRAVNPSTLRSTQVRILPPPNSAALRG